MQRYFGAELGTFATEAHTVEINSYIHYIIMIAASLGVDKNF